MFKIIVSSLILLATCTQYVGKIKIMRTIFYLHHYCLFQVPGATLTTMVHSSNTTATTVTQMFVITAIIQQHLVN